MAEDTSYLHNSVRICGSSWSTCGYCRGDRGYIVNRDPSESSKAYSILADSLTPSVYETFLNHGWRRSGRVLYRPDNAVSCCPAITIRLPVAKFQPTKSQRKLRRQAENMFNKSTNNKDGRRPAKDFSTSIVNNESNEQILKELQRSGLIDDLREWTTRALRHTLDDAAHCIPAISFKIHPRRPKSDPNIITMSTSICAAISGASKGRIDRAGLAKSVAEELEHRHVSSSSTNIDRQSTETSSSTDTITHKKHKTDCCRVGLVAVDAHEASGQVLLKVKFGTSSMDDASADETYIKSNSDVSEESADHVVTNSHAYQDKLVTWWHRHHPNRSINKPRIHGLVVTTLPAHESALLPEVHRLYFQYQHKIHKDPDPFADCGPDQANGNDCPNDWEVENAPIGWLERANTMLREHYKEMPQFNRIIEAYGQFYAFLVDSPLMKINGSTLENSVDQGTYHQLYHVHGLLVAVGVVDVLPGGLSSVYLFYDPSFASDVLPLGKYAILKEIEWTMQNKLPYYYLGYYIESCPKMRYKADYYPSELLCPVTHEWVDANEAKATIAEKSSEHNYCQLRLDVDSDTTGAALTSEMPSQIKLGVGIGQPVTLDMLHPRGQELIGPLLQDFISEAGTVIAPLCTITFV